MKREKIIGDYEFYDERNELSNEKSIRDEIEKKICEKIKNEYISAQWQKLVVQKTTIYDVTSGVYFLNGANGGFDIQGYFDAKCYNGVVYVKDVYFIYTWNDEIDANSVEETFNRNYLNNLDGYLTDYVHQLENVWDTTVEAKWKPNYRVRIYGTYEKNEEKRLKCD